MFQNRAMSHAGNTEDTGHGNRAVAGEGLGKPKIRVAFQRDRTVRTEARPQRVKNLNWKLKGNGECSEPEHFASKGSRAMGGEVWSREVLSDGGNGEQGPGVMDDGA